MSSAARPLTCHRCGSGALELTEFHVEAHLWDGGLYLVDGRISPAGEKVSTPGDVLPERTSIRCDGCGHTWHPRRPVGMPYEPEVISTGSNSPGGGVPVAVGRVPSRVQARDEPCADPANCDVHVS